MAAAALEAAYPVKLAFCPERGRYLVAARDIVEGEVVCRVRCAIHCESRASAFGFVPNQAR